VGTIKCDSKPEEASHGSNPVLVGITKAGEFGMLQLRSTLAVVASHECNDFDLVIGESSESI
jgi:hypothetical protein